MRTASTSRMDSKLSGLTLTIGTNIKSLEKA